MLFTSCNTLSMCRILVRYCLDHYGHDTDESLLKRKYPQITVVMDDVDDKSDRHPVIHVEKRAQKPKRTAHRNIVNLDTVRVCIFVHKVYNHLFVQMDDVYYVVDPPHITDHSYTTSHAGGVQNIYKIENDVAEYETIVCVGISIKNIEYLDNHFWSVKS